MLFVSIVKAVFIGVLAVCVNNVILDGSSTIEDPVIKLRSEDPNDLRKGVQLVLDERQTTIKPLESTLRDSRGSETLSMTMAPTIYLLGKIHAVESCQILVDNVTHFHNYFKRPALAYERYPCIGALIDIGYTAVEPLLLKIEESEDKDIAMAASLALNGVLGKTVAIFCLQNRAHHQDNLVKRARILSVLQYFDKWPKLYDDAVIYKRSEDATTREKAAEEILEKRRKSIEDIGKIVKDFKDTPARKETVKTAIMLLGKLRAVEAVPLLVDNLLLHGAGKVDFQPANGSYPCVDALVDIGSPAIEPLCVKAESTDDEATMKAIASAMKRMLGTDVAVFWLLDRAQRSADRTKRDRLYTVQQWINKWKDQNPK